MVEESKRNNDCFLCGDGKGHGNFVLRWVLGIVILVAIFSLGMLVGELKSTLGYGGGYGGYGMMGRGYGINMMQRGYGYDVPYYNMMGGYGYPIQSQQSATEPVKK